MRKQPKSTLKIYKPTSFASFPFQKATLRATPFVLIFFSNMKLTLILAAKEAKKVQVTGNFDNWQRAVPAKLNKDGLWEASADVKPDSKLVFKWIVDGEWTVGTGYETERDEAGNDNCVMKVGPAPSMLPKMFAKKEEKVIEEKLPAIDVSRLGNPADIFSPTSMSLSSATLVPASEPVLTAAPVLKKKFTFATLTRKKAVPEKVEEVKTVEKTIKKKKTLTEILGLKKVPAADTA